MQNIYDKKRADEEKNYRVVIYLDEEQLQKVKEIVS